MSPTATSTLFVDFRRMRDRRDVPQYLGCSDSLAQRLFEADDDALFKRHAIPKKGRRGGTRDVSHEQYEALRKRTSVWFFDTCAPNSSMNVRADDNPNAELWAGLYACGHLVFEKDSNGKVLADALLEVFRSEGLNPTTMQDQISKEGLVAGTGVRVTIGGKSPIFAVHMDVELLRGFPADAANFRRILRRILAATQEAFAATGNPLQNPNDLDFSYVDCERAYTVLRSIEADRLANPVAIALRDWHRSRTSAIAIPGCDDERASSSGATTILQIHNHNYGETQVGDRNEIKIEGSTVGAIATGKGAAATGTVTVPDSSALSRADHQKYVDSARHALIDDEAHLEELSKGLSEALGQFLRIAREIQVDQMSMKDAQAKMKETLDEVWAEQIAKGLKPQLLPNTLEVAGAIARNPIMVEVAKKLIGL